MKILTAAIAFALIASSASAYTTCTRTGNMVRCWGSNGSYTCTVIGNITRCW